MDDMKVRIAGTMKSIKDIDPKIIREWDAAIAKENAKESASGRNAKERWKLFKNISRFGILQRNPTEEDNLSSRSSLYTPFKRTSSNFYGSRLWSDLPLPIDECNDNDFDFPMLRKKNDNEKAFRVTSLQLNVTPKNKQPLARHISSPTRFNYSTKLKDNNRISDSSSFSSKMSIRGFIRRMSERRQRPTAESDFMRDRRKTAVNKTTSIRSINEEEVINNTFEERDENVDRVVSYISKCSEETEDDTSISKNYRKRNSEKKKLSNKQHEHEPQHQNYENSKNERSESGFDSINDGIFNNSNNNNSNHIPLNIPLPPTREPPCPPIETDYTPQQSPVPCRKHHKQPIPDINFIESTPSPIPKGNHFENDYDYYANISNNFNMKNVSLIENDIDADENSADVDKNSDGKHQENEIKIDELNVRLTDVNVRKEGFISEKIRHGELEELEIKVYPKDKITERMITSAIVSNDFLCNILDNESIKTVVNAMLLESYDENSFIINEGDSGNFLYVSAEGMFDVIKGGNSLKTFGPGVVFGELSILYKARRFASIKALTFCKVFSLERKVFQKIMMSCGRREREENIKFLSSVSVLKDLPLIVLNKISDLLKREYFPSGSTIIRQGDPGDKFYIIRSGSVNVIKSEEEKGQRLVGILKRGAYFGEQALIHQDKRLASIIANPPGTDCLTLDRNAFDAYLGGLDKIRNTKIVDQNIPKTRKVSSKSEYGNIQLNELKLIGTLGVGGFGRVELVQYKNKTTFALKSLKKIEMLQQQQQEHAYNEKEILFACNSPFIVRLYKTYKDRKYLYYLMEPCLGGDVWTILQKYKFFDEKISKFMTACVVLALEYLHSKHIIYRDLKPENLMLDTNGYIKLVDFGFAKFIKPGSKTWTFAGTPEYVAPEIILNKGHDLSSDCWSLGILIHELLIGKPPFRAKEQMQTYNLILRGIDCIQLPQKIPKKAQILIKRLCRQSGSERLGVQKNGIKDIKMHSWFSDFTWDRLEARKMSAPLILPVKNNVDLSNFDEYSKDFDDPQDDLSGWDKDF